MDFYTKGIHGAYLINLTWRLNYSVELGKQMYARTRRWLDPNHVYQSTAMMDHFNRQEGYQAKPNIVSIEEQLWHAIEYEASKEARNR